MAPFLSPVKGIWRHHHNWIICCGFAAGIAKLRGISRRCRDAGCKEPANPRQLGATLALRTLITSDYG
jgi:hypothetical protein